MSNITDGPEDHELVSLCRQGDLEAFELLVKRHQKKMFNVAFRMTGNYEDSCEIVQDAFVSAYKALKKFEGKSSFTTWLHAIIVNVSRTRLKKMRQQNFHEQYSLDDPLQAVNGNMKAEPASHNPSAADMVEKKELQEKIQECINALDFDFREVVVLRDIQGFAYTEISAILKIAEGTVKSRLSRARESLRNCLKNFLGKL